MILLQACLSVPLLLPIQETTPAAEGRELLSLDCRGIDALFVSEKDAKLHSALRMLDDRLRELPGEMGGGPMPEGVFPVLRRVLEGPMSLRVFGQERQIAGMMLPLFGELRLSEQTQLPFSVVMMDLDGFKTVNDTFGHNVGDELLYSLFNFLAQRMRSSDFLARYGGDELTLVMRNTDLEAAQIVTKKVIELLKEYHFDFPSGKKVELGMSAGIAVYPTHANNPSDMIRAADSALYHAKKHQRGQYAIAKSTTGRLNPIKVKEEPT